MEHAEKIARLTDNIADMRDDPESKDRVLDAQTILDGAYHRLVESGNVEAGKKRPFQSSSPSNYAKKGRAFTQPNPVG